jgi:N-glycosidase YbiA
MPILFFRTADKYGCFSNFSKHPVHVYGSLWPTTEHAYQAMKFFPHRADVQKRIQTAATPREAANIGRDRSLPLNPNWERSAGGVLQFRLPDYLDSLLQPNDGLEHEEPLFNRWKDLMMYEVEYAKAMQHPDVRSRLLETQSEAIIEDSNKDRYWAWGSDHTGENKLGRIWMAVRNALTHGASTKTAFGKPERVNFVCTADYPWQPEYGPGDHPGAQSAGSVGREYEAFECIHCGHYYEARARPPV